MRPIRGEPPCTPSARTDAERPSQERRPTRCRRRYRHRSPRVGRDGRPGDAGRCGSGWRGTCCRASSSHYVARHQSPAKRSGRQGRKPEPGTPATPTCTISSRPGGCPARRAGFTRSAIHNSVHNSVHSCAQVRTHLPGQSRVRVQRLELAGQPGQRRAVDRHPRVEPGPGERELEVGRLRAGPAAAQHLSCVRHEHEPLALLRDRGPAGVHGQAVWIMVTGSVILGATLLVVRAGIDHFGCATFVSKGSQ